MNCKFDKEIIQKYVDNTIEPLELIVLKEHIAVCQDCKFELDLMSKLEDSMYQYFDNLPEHMQLNEFSTKVLEKCYVESNSAAYKKGIAKVFKMNKVVVSNAARYTSYLPGSKLAAKAAKKAGGSIDKAVRGYVKSSFRRFIANVVK